MSWIDESSTDIPRVVVVAGPTASGKSSLALAIAEEFSGVIINADSQQRFADLRILTARPSPADEARVPHRLFGDLGATESGSAAEWATKAATEITAATARNQRAILVGGTGLYFRALMEGLNDMPAVPVAVRAEAKRLRDDIGPAAFHAQLAARDPASAARLNPGDSQRVLRAWEVIEATGQPLSVWQQAPAKPPLTARYVSIVLMPPREDLYAACDARLAAMIAGGALAEVQALLHRGLDLSTGVGKALGVADLAAALRGEVALEQAVILVQTATRQYAKRQMTWFRNQFNAALMETKKLSERKLHEIFSIIRKGP